MILLIYRDEVYDKNTTRKGIAEIDLAKHRNGEIGGFLLPSRASTRASSITHPIPTPKASCGRVPAWKPCSS